LILQFHQSVAEADKHFGLDTFADIKDGNLKLKRDDKAEIPETVNASGSVPTACWRLIIPDTMATMRK
jgi:hypothetical protein